MAHSSLSLEAPDTLNKCILRIVDTSVYNPQTKLLCPTLQVTLPGFSIPAVFEEPIVEPGFMLNLTACDLGVQTVSCGTVFNDLPDGIYIIRYSNTPNDLVYVDYNHLRITKALDKYNVILCDLDIAACDPPEIVKRKMERLTMIRMYLDAAKAQVEVCHKPAKGMELYNYAVKLLDKMTCTTC